MADTTDPTCPLDSQAGLDGTPERLESHFITNSPPLERSHADPHPSLFAQSPEDQQTLAHLPITDDLSAATQVATAAPEQALADAPVAEATPPMIKSEPLLPTRDSIPAFIPVIPVKQEQATTPISATEGSGILPSTEMPVNESRGTKRPAPKSAPKKGLAKKAPPAKKQKLDSSARSKAKPKVNKSFSVSATPLGSSPAPMSIRGASPASDDEDEDEEEGSPDPDADVYCLCKRPDTGTFMIGCDGKCEDWYHGKCVGISKTDKNLIDRYICPICTKNGVGVTTWKRMCRREGCRMPARLAKKDEEPSKYCSDECGVLFFRSRLAHTRGANSAGKKSVRKSEASAEYDAGPRGGVIHSTELKSLVSSVSTFDDFKKLGDGVLSPPATPSPEQPSKTSTFDAHAYLDESQTQRLDEIQTKKEELRLRHTLLKDQSKMINIVRQAGIRMAEKKGLKPKDVCGYDDLVHAGEADFEAWRESVEGQTVLKSGVVEASGDEDGDTEMQTNNDGAIKASGPCMKKKCMKHHDWSKLALETNRSETIENSETMRALEREENEIQERAGLKARQVQSGDLGGYVVRHDGAANGVTTPKTMEATPVATSAESMHTADGPAAEAPAPDAAILAVVSDAMEVETV